MFRVTSYRFLAGLLTAALPGLAFQCGCDDCQPCTQERVGSLGLHPASAAWLPTADSVRFANSNGFRVTLHRVLLPADSVGQGAYIDPYYASYDLLTFTGLSGCGRYFQTERRRLRYETRALPLTLDYGLVRNLTGEYPAYRLPPQELTRALADTLPDAVLLSFNGQFSFRLPVVRRPYRQEFQGLRYLDSVRVAGRTFFGVYRQLLPPPATSSAVIRLQTVYFQPGQGVVGFAYSNNEQWARY